MIIGLYGRIGSGKTTLCNYLRTKGFFVIDADKISRDILMPGKKGLQAVVDTFGADYLNPDGRLNRKKLGDYVFSNREALCKLNGITHPLIEEEITRSIKQHRSRHIVIEGAVLYATKIVDLCDKTVVVTSNNTLARIMKRDFLTEGAALSRIQAQEVYEKADILIENNGTLPEFYQKIDEMLLSIL